MKPSAIPLHFKNDAIQFQLDSPSIVNMTPADITRVLMIYTGGTIGMKNSVDGYFPEANYLTEKLSQNSTFHDLSNSKILETQTVLVSDISKSDLATNAGVPFEKLQLPVLTTPYSLYKKRIKYSILEYSPLLDSSNMVMKDWIKLACDIELNYQQFDAFLILHGTDTMAYTASALSFLLENIGKTVLITGSQVPISEVRNDAIDNLLGALTIAGHFIIPEVGLFFGSKLFRGNRATKINALDFNAFESPNLPPLVSVGVNIGIDLINKIDVSWEKIFVPKSIKRFKGIPKTNNFQAHKVMNPAVVSLRIFPGITEETVKAFFGASIKGVVLETFGSGNAPSNRPELLEIIKEACNRGIVIVNCSQCKKATVSGIYETGIALQKLGVIPGADMTPECALTKLAYLLGKYEDPVKVREEMVKSLAGELTIVNPRQRFAYIPNPINTKSSSALISSIMAILGFAVHTPTLEAIPSQLETTISALKLSDMNINESEEGENENDRDAALEKQLVPLALVHSARKNDLQTISLLLNEFPFMINIPTEGVTPLQAATIENKLAAVKILLQNGANVHIRDRYGRSCLLNAVLFNYDAVARILFKAGAHFSVEEALEVTCFAFDAVQKDNISRLKMFMEFGLDPNITNQDGRTILHIAASLDRLEIVKYLVTLAPKSSLNRTFSKNSWESNLDGLSFEYDLNLEPKDLWGKTPMDDARHFENHQVVKVLNDALNITL